MSVEAAIANIEEQMGRLPVEDQEKICECCQEIEEILGDKEFDLVPKYGESVYSVAILLWAFKMIKEEEEMHLNKKPKGAG